MKYIPITNGNAAWCVFRFPKANILAMILDLLMTLLHVK